MKTILVINGMPENCDECPLQRWGIDGWNCTPMNKVIEDDKPSWCPLKPLPKRNEYRADTKHEDMDEYSTGYADGWNDCLKEINE